MKPVKKTTKNPAAKRRALKKLKAYSAIQQ
jgi:hypothetical protein